MKTTAITNSSQNKNIGRLVLFVGLMLLIPLLAMQFTREVNWTFFDFMFAGTLLFGTGLAYELISRKSRSFLYRAGLGMAVIASFLLVWVNAAVGIIGDDNPANLFYLLVPLVGLIGSVIARFESRGMMCVAIVAATVQALIPVIALFVWSPDTISWAPGVVPVFGLNFIFVMLFIGSALLFRQAGFVKNSKR